MGAERAVRRRALAIARRSGSFARVIDQLDRIAGDSSPALAVLTYHRVSGELDDPRCDPALISASPGEFEDQLALLSRRYRFLSASDVVAARVEQRGVPARSLLVTFDDAYADFADVAWPILRNRGIPVALFVPTDFPGGSTDGFWWDRLYRAVYTTGTPTLTTPAGPLDIGTPADRERTLRRLQATVRELNHDHALEFVAEICGSAEDVAGAVLDWDRIRTLAREGVELGAHTVTHPFLDRVTPAAAAREIQASVDDLTREVGRRPTVFAYPAGAHTPEAVAAVAAAGIDVAFTTQRGVNDLRSADWLRLRRINVGPLVSASILTAQILGYTLATQSGHVGRRPSAVGVGEPR